MTIEIVETFHENPSLCAEIPKGQLLKVLDGRVGPYYVACVVTGIDNRVVEILKEIKEPYAGSNAELARFDSLPELDKLVANPEVFKWVVDQAMNALASIGTGRMPSQTLEFKALETVGAAFGHTAGLARIDFQ